MKMKSGTIKDAKAYAGYHTSKEGKKYNIMNDFYLIGKNSQDNTTKVESREERAKKIFKEVKDLIMEAKNRNTFNF